eukprot:scaffold159419_cov62-Cyclotella_meneghiniana.AAC.2
MISTAAPLLFLEQYVVKSIVSCLLVTLQENLESKHQTSPVFGVVMYENRLYAIAMCWLPVVRPQLTKEDIIKLKSWNFKFKYFNFTESEQEIIQGCLSETGKVGALKLCRPWQTL